MIYTTSFFAITLCHHSCLKLFYLNFSFQGSFPQPEKEMTEVFLRETYRRFKEKKKLASKYDDENSSDVVDSNTTCLSCIINAVLKNLKHPYSMLLYKQPNLDIFSWFPPFILQFLQLSLVQQFQNTEAFVVNQEWTFTYLLLNSSFRGEPFCTARA